MMNGGSVSGRERNRMYISREEKDGTNHNVSKSNRKQYVTEKEQVQEGLNECACKHGREHVCYVVRGFTLDRNTV